MKNIINQIEQIEKNIHTIPGDMMVAVNKKYRDLDDSLNKLIALIPVIYDEY